jgi:AraC-like DNA-binding protein
MKSGHRVCELASAVPYLLARDTPPGKVLKLVGIPTHAILDPEAWLPRDLFLSLVNALSSSTGDAHCALHIAEMNQFMHLGALGEAILGAPTLREAIGVVCQRAALVQTGTEFRLSENRLTARLDYEYAGRTGESPKQYVEGILMFLHMMLALTGQNEIKTVSFAHPRSRNSSDELERAFGPRLSFGADHNAISFDRGLLDLPLQSSSTTACQMLPERPSEEEVVRAVLINISGHLAYQVPTLDTTAAALGLHSRTLERRLSRWGASFESLLDEFRRNRSLQLIQQGTHTLNDIAFLVGYSDSAHFTRAFRRWTGIPPRDYARRLRQGVEGSAGEQHMNIPASFIPPMSAVLAK